jgi:hypothetical protein
MPEKKTIEAIVQLCGSICIGESGRTLLAVYNETLGCLNFEINGVHIFERGRRVKIYYFEFGKKKSLLGYCLLDERGGITYSREIIPGAFD